MRGRGCVPLGLSRYARGSEAHPGARYSHFLCERRVVGSMSLCFDRSLFVSYANFLFAGIRIEYDLFMNRVS